MAGSSWTKITISLVNMGWLCWSPAGVCVLGLANCDDKQMLTLVILWKRLFEVRNTATQWCNGCSHRVPTEAF